MKIVTTFLLATVCLSADAQTYRQSIGAGSLGPAGEKEPVTYDQIKAKLVGTNIFRVVTNQPFNVQKSVLWRPVLGQVISTSGDYLILQKQLVGEPGSPFVSMALRNYSGDATDGNRISTVAMRIGTVDWRERPIELWDCGVPFKPKPPAPPVAAAMTNIPQSNAVIPKP